MCDVAAKNGESVRIFSDTVCIDGETAGGGGGGGKINPEVVFVDASFPDDGVSETEFPTVTAAVESLRCGCSPSGVTRIVVQQVSGSENLEIKNYHNSLEIVSADVHEATDPLRNLQGVAFTPNVYLPTTGSPLNKFDAFTLLDEFTLQFDGLTQDLDTYLAASFADYTTSGSGEDHQFYLRTKESSTSSTASNQRQLTLDYYDAATKTLHFVENIFTAVPPDYASALVVVYAGRAGSGVLRSLTCSGISSATISVDGLRIETEVSAEQCTRLKFKHCVIGNTEGPSFRAATFADVRLQSLFECTLWCLASKFDNVGKLSVMGCSSVAVDQVTDEDYHMVQLSNTVADDFTIAMIMVQETYPDWSGNFIESYLLLDASSNVTAPASILQLVGSTIVMNVGIHVRGHSHLLVGTSVVNVRELGSVRPFFTLVQDYSSFVVTDAVASGTDNVDEQHMEVYAFVKAVQHSTVDFARMDSSMFLVATQSNAIVASGESKVWIRDLGSTTLRCEVHVPTIVADGASLVSIKAAASDSATLSTTPGCGTIVCAGGGATVECDGVQLAIDRLESAQPTPVALIDAVGGAKVNIGPRCTIITGTTAESPAIAQTLFKASSGAEIQVQCSFSLYNWGAMAKVSGRAKIYFASDEDKRVFIPSAAPESGLEYVVQAVQAPLIKCVGTNFGSGLVASTCGEIIAYTNARTTAVELVDISSAAAVVESDGGKVTACYAGAISVNPTTAPTDLGADVEVDLVLNEVTSDPAVNRITLTLAKESPFVFNEYSSPRFLSTASGVFVPQRISYTDKSMVIGVLSRATGDEELSMVIDHVGPRNITLSVSEDPLLIAGENEGETVNLSDQASFQAEPDFTYTDGPRTSIGFIDPSFDSVCVFKLQWRPKHYISVQMFNEDGSKISEQQVFTGFRGGSRNCNAATNLIFDQSFISFTTSSQGCLQQWTEDEETQIVEVYTSNTTATMVIITDSPRPTPEIYPAP